VGGRRKRMLSRISWEMMTMRRNSKQLHLKF
jgi:hypothetical protein